MCAFSLRPALPDDLDALTALEQRCFSSDRLSRRSFRKWLKRQHAGLIVALDEQQQLAGYALVLLQPGTRLARLYSIAVDPQQRGKKLGEHLLDAAEDYAHQQRRLFLRLEVRKDNTTAIALYERLGYRLFAQRADYYEDHEDALRYQKRLHYQPKNLRGTSNPQHLPWVQQTTPFTCGPACLLMALAALKQQTPTTTEELLLWREATTIFMTAGHGGCHPLGLALAARHRGLNARVWCNQTGPLFVDSVRDSDKKAVITTLHNHFVSECAQQKIPVCYEDFSAADVDKAITAGSIVLVLISTWRLDGRKAPHWVAISGSDEECFYIHDPDPGEDQVPMDCQHVPITREKFDQMRQYGQAKLRTAVILSRP
ncbi:GNAT family N-acetyltransferase/peptidase C39 family protein [Alcanivorax sp.]|uniref:GNAT family N-acetyltransferase/peptidase C39 family protein n=1 Tax=Alcanivorax sp. TaxID=1872427 RepID=UPI000C6B2410|nr:GNAT family N-acetyltransferase/peptidase C39 family protein [Alcanivorax sp.]MBQ26235.1 ribosomal-protein-alanine acetyltransferase [Alcanivorax sp.]|tara:strand:+ start:297 stop:1409 length:1113 start_codon:yes stop_codon:yes gene_type:complete